MPLTLDLLKSNLDTVWVLFTGCLVFFMCAGFALLETGFSRAKNAVNVLAMNYAVVAVSTLAFWAAGFGLMFGNGTPFVGLNGLFPTFVGASPFFKSLEWASVPLAAKFFFELVFADTAITIVSGIVVERMKFSAYMLFSILMVLFLYPVTGHWAWGGGFLSTLAIPFQDFAGSTVVHSVGGWAALTGAILLGARKGKYDEQGKPVTITGHNMSLATLGTLILWLGWFGFNPGSTLAADGGAIAHITMTTMIAGSAGLASALILSLLRTKKTDIGAILNGTLAGLVAITAGCNAVSPTGALLIGVIAGALCTFSGPIIERLHVDDPVGALSVHLVNGIWGTLAVGIFATKAGSVGTLNGLLYGGGTGLLWSQLIGVAAIGAFTVVGSSICWLIVKALVGLRVSEASEVQGVDIGEHGNLAYPQETHPSSVGTTVSIPVPATLVLNPILVRSGSNQWHFSERSRYPRRREEGQWRSNTH